MTTLATIIDSLGVQKIATICGVSPRAVYKWRKANVLPRTEYTGETNYSALLSHELQNRFSVGEILNLGRPKKSQY